MPRLRRIQVQRTLFGPGAWAHTCKECAALPAERREELRAMTRLEHIAGKYPQSREDWATLERYAADKRYPEAAKFAACIFNGSRRERKS